MKTTIRNKYIVVSLVMVDPLHKLASADDVSKPFTFPIIYIFSSPVVES